MRHLNVYGIDMKDYSVTEAMRMITEWLDGGSLKIVSFVSVQMLLAAAGDPSYKEWISFLDITSPTSVDIIEALGRLNHQRKREIEDGLLFFRMLKKLSDENRKLFLITSDEDTMSASVSYLAEHAPGINLVGTSIYNDSTNPDALINDINIEFPDVIFSRISDNSLRSFLPQRRDMLNAKIWVSLKEDFHSEGAPKDKPIHRLINRIRHLRFLDKVSKYTYPNTKNETESH